MIPAGWRIDAVLADYIPIGGSAAIYGLPILIKREIFARILLGQRIQTDTTDHT
jgi:hypothetical protein